MAVKQLRQVYLPLINFNFLLKMYKVGFNLCISESLRKLNIIILVPVL